MKAAGDDSPESNRLKYRITLVPKSYTFYKEKQ
jgi:hypothetical protein